jgi:hypothetical protein
MVKFRQIPDLCRKVWSDQKFRFSKPVEFPTAIIRKLLIVWSHFMDHWKTERVAYHNGIRSFRSFSQSETKSLSAVLPLFCPETEFSSEDDLQNSVTSKPFVG